MLSPDVFANPPSKYRPIPFWFWNSKMRRGEVEAQIRDFHAKGIGGFFIHARFGLETEYLSEEWMDCIAHAVEIAQELGMEVWLYDENGFPSGIGDLKVSRVPDYRSKFVDVTEGEYSAGETVELELPSGDVMMAYAYRRGAPAGERIDLTSFVADNRLTWTAPEGDWSVVVYSKRMLEDPNDVIFGVDYLNPDAMRAYFDFTLDPYEKALGQHFGKTIKGIFTDEPTLLPWHHDIEWYGLRKHTRVVVWDDLIETEMISRVKMDARAFLPHLFFDVDASTPKVRRAFWQVVSDLYMKAFFLPYSQWCEKHNLKLTGHVLFEEGLYINTDFQADIAASLSQFHIPGTDHLGEVTEVPYGGFCNTPRQLTNLQGEKLVTSIAHLNGREAAISETYGCAGWGLSFEKMKWMADWQYSLGVNMLCPHAVFYSIEGFRKSDAPPSENHMAAWKHYRKFGDYIGRLSYALREGRHVAKVALLYPLREFWGEHTVGREGEDDRATSDSFDLCASVLPRLHFDYDIIPEQALASAKIADGRICIHDEEYEVLIAPPSVMEGRAKDAVQQFVTAGGRWIQPPTSSKGREAVADELDAALRQAIAPDVEIVSIDDGPLPDVRYVHREAEGKHVFFLINTSESAANTDISLETTGAVELWDPEAGEVAPAAGVELADGRLRIRHDFAPYGSAIYVVDAAKPTQSSPRVEVKREEVMIFPDDWRFHTEEPNALILGEWTFKPRIHGAGEEYTYNTTSNCEHVPEKLLLMLDDVEYRASLMGRMDLTVDVNGQRWHRPEFGWYLDKGFKSLDIAGALKQGENSVSVIIQHSAWSGQPHVLNAPPVLLGDFTCDPASRTLRRPVTTAKAGSWTEFGYPFLSGTGVYTQTFRLSKDQMRGRLMVAVDALRDSVEIIVNGKTADVRLWQPWEADVTDLVHEGENDLTVKVTNSMVNFIEAQARPSGLMGRVRLVSEPLSR